MKLNLATLIIALGSTATFLAVGNPADLPVAVRPTVAERPKTAPREILIEAVIFEVTSNSSNDAQTICFGTSDSQSQATPSIQQNGNANSLNPLGTTEDGLAPLLARLADNKQVKILQRPRIQTADGIEARLFVGDSLCCSRTRQDQPGVCENPQKHSANQVLGVTLDVSPSITSTRMLRMHIAQTIERFAGITNIATVGTVPITSRQSAETDVTLVDGQTLVLAGRTNHTQDKPAKGIPVLKDIPLVGGLFRNHPQNIQVETILALRATILPPKEAKANIEAGKS